MRYRWGCCVATALVCWPEVPRPLERFLEVCGGADGLTRVEMVEVRLLCTRSGVVV